MLKSQIAVELYRSYLDKSGWLTPTVDDCSRFIMQEAGELDSALMKAGFQSRGYARNTPANADARDAIIEELGDVAMMLVTMANLLGVNLYDAMYARLERQHYKRVKELDSDSLKNARSGFQVLKGGRAYPGTPSKKMIDAIAYALKEIDADRETIKRWQSILW